MRFGYIDRVIQEPVLGARPYHFEFFRSIRQEVIRATDEVVLSVRGPASLRAMALRGLRDREINLDDMYVRWNLSKKARLRLVEKRQKHFLRLSEGTYFSGRSWWKRVTDEWSAKCSEMYNKLKHDLYLSKRRSVSNALEEANAELDILKYRLTAPWRRMRSAFNRTPKPLATEEELTALSEWDRTQERGDWTWVSPKAHEDRAVTCPNSALHGCMDLWAPDLYNEFAGVCTTCGHHFPMEYQWLMFNCFDDGSISEFNEEVQAGNPLAFPGMDERLATAREKTGLRCACITFEARVEGTQAVVAVLAGAFRGGSVGAAEGAKFVAAAERARRKRFPFIVYCHGTAGIRIQEGTHGVIQMPRCTVAVRRYVEAGGLYLVIYDTNSYGGPVASFLGCAHYQFAIRSSNIGFAGPGVIKNTTGRDIPPDYHNCYQALARGHIQGVWDRRDVRTNLKQALLTMGGRNLYYR